MAYNRFRDAVQIQAGASNPIAVSRALVRAIDAVREENGDTKAICNDPACRMIAHQLAYLLGVPALDAGTGEYSRVMEVCEQRQGE